MFGSHVGYHDSPGASITHHGPDSTTSAEALEHLTETGFGGLAEAIQVLMNEAMRIERSGFQAAGPYGHTPGRVCYASGYKPKRVKTRVGEITFAVPKV